MEFMFFEVYIVYGQTEFPFRKPFETEFTIFPNGKGTFLKRKIITPILYNVQLSPPLPRRTAPEYNNNAPSHTLPPLGRFAPSPYRPIY